jgi:hypothetical protein
MERTWDPISSQQHHGKEPIYWWRTDGLGRDYARYPHTAPCVWHWFRECPQVQAGDPRTLRASFQALNSFPQRARLVDEYLKSEDIHRMDWPAKSPDLNPIEHGWDAFGRAIAVRQPPPRTIPELKTALMEGLPQALLNSVINSMHTRCACCLSVRGDHTPYKPHFHCHLSSWNSVHIGLLAITLANEWHFNFFLCTLYCHTISYIHTKFHLFLSSISQDIWKNAFHLLILSTSVYIIKFPDWHINSKSKLWKIIQ